MEEMIKIPLERLRILKDEKTRKMLEKKCGIEIAIDDDGAVRLSGEPSDIYFSKNVIAAIGRGFEPKDALLIIEKDYGLHVYHLKEEFGSENEIRRVKGRIIGEKGRMKREIEEATESRISVYGNTIAILAKLDAMEYARAAVEKLLHGAMHASVYKYLAEAKRKLFEERLRG